VQDEQQQQSHWLLSARLIELFVKVGDVLK